MKDIFGIDLGTTNSCIATIGEDGLPVVIKNLDDEFTTPSVVYYDEESDDCYVGKEAKSGMGGAPEQTIAFIKREMSNPNYRRTVNGKAISPVEVSALIVKKVVDDANEQRSYEGLPPIKKAVITVPAYFGAMERELTKQAGEIAGLEVLDLLNEPTAAALSYGTKGLEGKTFMVYDLGGGTFDISIMRMKDGVLTTLSTDGDHKLGGVDWDIALLDYALQERGLGVTYEDIKGERESAKMLLAAEVCKKNLSKSDKATIKLIYRRKPYLVEISRGLFEEITADLVENTIDMMYHALKIAREPLTANDIDEIILVGGSSYMPMIKKRIQKEFKCELRLDMFEPDRAVAQGAALHAAKLQGDGGVQVYIGEDMGARSYGTDVNDGNGGLVIRNILLRTDTLLYENTYQFATSFDGQTAASISLYENTSTDEIVPLKKSTKIMDKILEWGTPLPKNTVITMHVTRNKEGIVHVVGECAGKSEEFSIETKGLLNQQEVDRIKKTLSEKRV
jgi:molecular chaperone DnaK (HSP70)